MSDVVEAINSLVPNAKFTLVGGDYKNVIWNDDRTKPSEAEVSAEIIKLEQDYIAKQYARDRAIAYPSIQEQLDMQYWDSVNGTTTWKDAIEAVKTEHPKP